MQKLDVRKIFIIIQNSFSQRRPAMTVFYRYVIDLGDLRGAMYTILRDNPDRPKVTISGRLLSSENVTELIQTTRNWSSIGFDNIREPSSIGPALAQCARLTKITFFARGDISVDNLRRWGEALSQAPCLKVIELEHTLKRVLRYILFPIVVNCAHLKRIHATAKPKSGSNLLKSSVFPSFVNACMDASSLREISLQSGRIVSDFTAHQVVLVAQLIRHANLRKLSLSVGRRSASIKSWAIALQDNKTLQDLELRSNNKAGDVQVEEVAAFRDSLFQRNCTLRRLIVDNWTTDHWDLDALNDPFKLAAKKELPEECSYHVATIYFLLRLNNAGRDKIMAWEQAAPSSEKWLIATFANENDLSVVYFYLRRNPSVLQTCFKEK